MRWRVAVPALLLAVRFALFPLWALCEADLPDVFPEIHAVHVPFHVQPRAANAEEQAVIPSPTAVPAPADYAAKPFLTLIIVAMLLWCHGHVSRACREIGVIAPSAFRCLLDHPHHAPPAAA